MNPLLAPVSIGNVQIRFPVVLAALAGYSDLPFRKICRELEAPYCATEMMLDKCVLMGGKLTNLLARTDEHDTPCAGQLIGNEPHTMAAAARILADGGYDVIDLNFACPVRKALSRRRGGFIMSQPELAIEITKAVVEAVDKPVTLKLRKSFDQDDETRDDFWRIAEGAFDVGAAGICVHGRSVENKYSGPADWEFIKQVKDHFHDRIVMGSGDVSSPARAIAMLKQTGVDAVTAARGAMGNPWFFKQYLDLVEGREMFAPSLEEQRTVLLDHFQRMVEFYGPRRGPKIMRKQAIRYARMHPHPKRIRVAFVDVKNPDDWHRVIEEHYDNLDATSPESQN